MAKYRLTKEALQADPAVCDMLDIREVTAALLHGCTQLLPLSCNTCAPMRTHAGASGHGGGARPSA